MKQVGITEATYTQYVLHVIDQKRAAVTEKILNDIRYNPAKEQILIIVVMV